MTQEQGPVEKVDVELLCKERLSSEVLKSLGEIEFFFEAELSASKMNITGRATFPAKLLLLAPISVFLSGKIEPGKELLQKIIEFLLQ